MQALLIVDVQNDLCPGGNIGTREGDIIIPVLNKLLECFQVKLATKDWHPRKSVHFSKWPVHCVQNTSGAEFHGDLNASKIDKVFLKGTENKDDGYTAFDAPELEPYLRENNITELYITGLTTEYCIKETVLDSLEKGIKPIVIRDGVEGVNADPGDDEIALQELKEKGADIVYSKDLLKSGKT